MKFSEKSFEKEGMWAKQHLTNIKKSEWHYFREQNFEIEKCLFFLTRTVGVNNMPIKFCILQGKGSFSTWLLFSRVECTFNLLNNWRDPIWGETQPTWIWFPVATKSLLSLCPQVIAVTGLWNWKKIRWFLCITIMFLFFIDKAFYSAVDVAWPNESRNDMGLFSK